MSTNPSKPADIWTLGDLSTPWSIHVVVTLRIAQHIAEGRRQIDDLARAAGADPVHNAVRREWGGYTGYFADPDGYRWEIATNPGPIGQKVLP